MPPLDPETLKLGGIVLVAIVVLVAIRKAMSSKSTKKSIPGIERMLRDGRYLEAADHAIKADRPAEAIEYYLRAQQPGRAAHVAAKLGNARMASELYERSGNYQSAALWYEKAQNPSKAEEMRSKIAPAADLRPPSSELQRAPAPVKGGTSDAEIERKRRSRELAEAHMASGNIKSAADAYRDAGMAEEAIHLYVNVLALPGEAAPLIKSRGNVERAADLYELAGMTQEAASTLAESGLRAKNPEQYLDRIARLSAEVGLSYTTQLVRSRPLNAANKELHYTHAKLLEEKGQRDKALETFTGLREVAGGFKDVVQRIDSLRSPPAPPVRGQSTAQPAPLLAPVSGVADPLSLVAGRPRGVSGLTPAPWASAPPLSPPMPTANSPTPPAPVYVYRGVTDEEVALIAREAAAAAVKAAKRATPQLDVTYFKEGAGATKLPEQTRTPPRQIADTYLPPSTPTPSDPHPSAVYRSGLEAAPLPTSLIDGDVLAAKLGPSTESLRDAIAGGSASPTNVDLYYRLGLAYLAEGNWSSALDAFEQVELTLPGYRGAAKRAAEIRRWRDALVPHLTTLGVEGKERPAPARYVLRGELGRGGMAVVYRATDTVLGRDVALKFLSDALSARDDIRELFQREARAVAALNHPNIVTVYDFGTLEGRTFIAMEFIEGTTVKDLMAEKISVAETLRVLKQLLDALDLAHNRKIIHRDIKPSNVMLTASGLIKLMDFGLAKSIATGAEASMVAGTPAYMSPEQMVGQDVDHRTDIFAVGVMAYQMLTGALPFQGMDRMHPPTQLRVLAPSVPESLEQLVLASLAFDRNRRVQTAAEFAAPLKALLTAVQEISFR
ncbi:MAG: protein kinase [Deltaproteobacteria bacterium]|nr:protein kinase [Deltaproteobacteria bacterium]